VKERKRNNSTPTNTNTAYDVDDDNNKASELTKVRAKALLPQVVHLISTQTALQRPKAGRLNARGLSVFASAFYFVLVDVAAKGCWKKRNK